MGAVSIKQVIAMSEYRVNQMINEIVYPQVKEGACGGHTCPYGCDSLDELCFYAKAQYKMLWIKEWAEYSRSN